MGEIITSTDIQSGSLTVPHRN